MHSGFSSNIDFKVLSAEKIEKIHEATLTILQEQGVKIDDEEVKERLLDEGAESKDGFICLPPALIEKALDSAPNTITLYNRNKEPTMEIGKEQTYFGTHADMLEIIDPFTDEVRDFKRQDTELMCKIADYLPNIDFMLAVGLAADVPEKIQSQLVFLDVIRQFSKTINFSSNDVQGLKDQLEILNIAAGGLDKFKEKPFAFYYCEPIPPLYHPQESTDKLKLVAEAGVPSVYMPYCMLGGTSPVTFAGTLAQCNAEVLSGLVITQLFKEGAPIIYGAMPSIFDMKTTIGSYGAPEFNMLIAAASEMANYYSLPFYGTAGTSDAKIIDEQAVSEGTVSFFSSLLSQADLVHDVGIMDHCNSLSPEMVVLYNEILNMLDSYISGVEVNSEELALEVIREVGPAGHYLNHEHTANNFKKIWYSDLFSRAMQKESESEVRTKIKEQIKDINDDYKVSINDSKEVKQELDDFAAKLLARV